MNIETQGQYTYVTDGDFLVAVDMHGHTGWFEVSEQVYSKIVLGLNRPAKVYEITFSEESIPLEIAAMLGCIGVHVDSYLIEESK